MVLRRDEAAAQAGDIVWLWLEDIVDKYEGHWSLARYALTARDLGRPNGCFVGPGLLPSYPWLGKDRARRWITYLPGLENIPRDHPQILRQYTQPEVILIRRLNLDRHAHYDVKPGSGRHRSPFLGFSPPG
jgi:hypothetical protein